MSRTGKDALVEALADFPANAREERLGYVYMVTSPSGKMYVGQTKQKMRERMRQHRDEAWTLKCPRFYQAILSHGWDTMTVTILEHCPLSRLDEREIHLIAKFDTTHRQKGYNCDAGGGAGADLVRLPETLAKISDAKKKQWADGCFDGPNGPHSAEARKKAQDTLDDRREERVAKLQGRELHVALRNRETQIDRVKFEKRKRHAKKSPEAWAEWTANEGSYSKDFKQSRTMFVRRMEKLSTMQPHDGLRWMRRVYHTAKWTAEKRGVDFPSIERWYPLVSTCDDVDVLVGEWRENEAAWRTQGPRASSADGEAEASGAAPQV